MTNLFAGVLWASLVAGLVLKPAVVVFAALLVTRAMRVGRTAAAARHLVWTFAVCTLLLLPLLSAVVPRWEAEWMRTPGAVSAWTAVPVPAGRGVGESGPDERLASSTIPTDGPAASGAESPAATASARRPLIQFVAMAYLVGLVAALGWAMAGYVSVRRTASRAREVTDPEWIEILRDVAWEMDVNRPIRLLRSASSPMPMTWGAWRASILVPAAADAWSDERRRAVLRHEVAHVARRDCLTQAAAAAVCVAYWFHPVTWYAARQLRVERELACDDLVLGAGTGAHAYAGHLLEIARSFRAPLLVTPGAVSMARPSQLEGRLLAVLDPERSRRPLRRTAVAGAAVAVLAAVLPLAALGPARSAEAALVSAPIADTMDDAVPPLPDGPPAEARVQAAFGARLDLRLGARADVRITGWDRDAVQVRSWGQTDAGVTLERVAGGARIVSRPGSPDERAVHVEIRVPRRYDLQLRGGGSRTEIRDVAGRFTGSTEGGDLVLLGVGGDAALTTAGGTASISTSRLRGRVWTAGGRAALRLVTGDVEVKSGAAAVTVESRDRSGTLSVRSFSGAVRVVAETDGIAFDQPEGAVLVDDTYESVDIRTGRGGVEIGGAGGHARVHTGAGSITLRAARNSADLSTRAGDVFLRMLNTRDATVETGGGSVTIELPADFRGVIDATAAARGGRPGRIRSDFPLSAIPAASGILRRAGTIPGPEAATITIRATDGDVTIRRAPPAG